MPTNQERMDILKRRFYSDSEIVRDSPTETARRMALIGIDAVLDGWSEIKRNEEVIQQEHGETA